MTFTYWLIIFTLAISPQTNNAVVSQTPVVKYIPMTNQANCQLAGAAINTRSLGQLLISSYCVDQ